MWQVPNCSPQTTKARAVLPFLLHQKHTVDPFPNCMKKSSLTGIIWKVGSSFSCRLCNILQLFSTNDEYSPFFPNLIIPSCTVFFYYSRAAIYVVYIEAHMCKLWLRSAVRILWQELQISYLNPKMLKYFLDISSLISSKKKYSTKRKLFRN